ncbi:MAG: class I adenylate-forming enzyme family protein [Planctomycetota bacterium]|jgi:long-chain acyl-CoA synthetase
MSKPLVAQLLKRARQSPDHLAIIAGEQTVTYGELRQRILAAAAELASLGVQPGDCVILAASGSPAFAYGYFATHLTGAVAVPLDPQAPDTRLAHVAGRVEPRAIFAARAYEHATLGPVRAIDDLAGLESNGDEPQGPRPDDLADLLFTTGTSGAPKGVMLTHRNILAAATNINGVLKNDASDREVVPLPLSHSFGLGRLRCNALAGGTVILVGGFKLPGEILNAMERWKATGLAVVPAGMAVLVRFGQEELAGFSDQLKYMEFGSAPMPLATKQLLIRILPRTRVWMHYGLTEASRCTFIEFHDSRDFLDSIGKPTPNVEVRIVDEQNRDVPPGAPGEIVVKGGMVAAGYWQDPERTAKTLVDGWLHTGDLGHNDEHGYVYLHGRKGDMINVGGFNVSPVEVEEVLAQHPAIEHGACIGIPDPNEVSGEVVKVFLVLVNGQARPTRRELVDWLKPRLEPYKVPVAFEWVDSLPKTGSGKLQRGVLREREAAAEK